MITQESSFYKYRHSSLTCCAEILLAGIFAFFLFLESGLITEPVAAQEHHEAGNTDDTANKEGGIFIEESYSVGAL